MFSFPEKVRRRWPDLHGPGIVAVSGGADSVALLRVMATWNEPLIVAHLNHRLRGDDSVADERFVRELAASQAIPFRSVAIDIGAERQGDNLEGFARQIRYDWLTSLAIREGASWVATGHTADDQAETVLHRLLRGAGMQGLRGIAETRELKRDILLVRPLLHATRTEIVDYLRSIDQSWRDDHTNRDPGFTRNRIRHELLPILRTYNPAVSDVLNRLAEQANEIHFEQELAAQRLLEQAELPRAGGKRILNLEALALASSHRVRQLFRLLWHREGWPLRDMTFEHWKRLVAVALEEETAIDLPGGISARRKDRVLQIGR